MITALASDLGGELGRRKGKLGRCNDLGFCCFEEDESRMDILSAATNANQIGLSLGWAGWRSLAAKLT